MEITPEAVERVLKVQIARSRQALADTGYTETSVRARIVHISWRSGGPILDVGTGACACMAVALARRRLPVIAIDHASSAVRIAQERSAGKLGDYLEVRHAEATNLPFPDSSFRVVVAFDALCHTPDPGAVLAEMFRVCVRNGVVLIGELNQEGRQLTRHRDTGFERSLAGLMGRHCLDCQRVDFPHHWLNICEA